MLRQRSPAGSHKEARSDPPAMEGACGRVVESAAMRQIVNILACIVPSCAALPVSAEPASRETVRFFGSSLFRVGDSQPGGDVGLAFIA